MSVFSHIDFDHHEQVVYGHDKASGLRAIIAIHNSNLGPALGGCRMWPYANDDEALRDVLRLSRGMTYKSALANLPLGGGKAVIRLPQGDFDRAALFRAFGREVERLEGRYLTAEDVGTGVADMEWVRTETAHVAGLPAAQGVVGGDPSPWTALGVLSAMEEAVRRRHGSGIAGATVAVQGLGHVGSHLCELLANVGARLVVADVDDPLLQPRSAFETAYADIAAGVGQWQSRLLALPTSQLPRP